MEKCMFEFMPLWCNEEESHCLAYKQFAVLHFYYTIYIYLIYELFIPPNIT